MESERPFITLFLCGDVMTGRGVDQILPHPADPMLHEPHVTDARDYVLLAERKNGPIPRPVRFDYVWGGALAELENVRPDARIVNLETSVTRSDDYWRDKGIHYRMSPQNAACLTAARLDCCALANNHVLDWGYAGLEETLDVLATSGLRTAGAGRDLAEAEAPAVIEVEGKGRVLVFSYGSETSGIPVEWAAGASTPGVAVLPDFTGRTVRRIGDRVREVKRDGDIAVLSVHWGNNWGYEISSLERELAHLLIDEAGIDVIHGHSSHHVKGIEVHHGKLVLHGCGDFLDDYEGISGYERYRGDLGLMYFVVLEPRTGDLLDLKMTPTQVARMRVRRAAEQDVRWLADVLGRECAKLGSRVRRSEDQTLVLEWKDG